MLAKAARCDVSSVLVEHTRDALSRMVSYHFSVMICAYLIILPLLDLCCMLCRTCLIDLLLVTGEIGHFSQNSLVMEGKKSLAAVLF